MIFFLVLLNAGNYGSCPLDYQIFQAVPLIQVCVHELLHRLSWQSALLTFLVKLSLLLIDVVY